jgi:isopentenyl-diphosphate delta-isomerase
MNATSDERPSADAAPERVVLLDESANPIGSTEKSLVHHASTPFHLAFSCYLFDDAGNVLLTRRSMSKQTWPGVWTNSFCGHPEPGEALVAAVERRARKELGAAIFDIRLLDPDFRYRAVDSSGIVENEACPVFKATLSGTLSPRSDEVMELAWVNPDSLAQSAMLTPFAFSPWMVLQMRALQQSWSRNAAAIHSGASEKPWI